MARPVLVMLGASVLGNGGLTVLGVVESSSFASGLLVYGPLGVICAWLMWRMHEQEKRFLQDVRRREEEYQRALERAKEDYSQLVDAIVAGKEREH